MKTPIFNVHDVALLLIMAECLIMTALLLTRKTQKVVSNRLLAAFLLLNAMSAFDVLAFWADIPRHMLVAQTPHLLFVFGFSYVLQGAVLLWYTKSLLYADFRLEVKDALHLLPSLGYLLAALHFYHGADIQTRMFFVDNPVSLFADAWFRRFWWSQKIIPVVYGCACIYHLLRYRGYLKDHFSNLESIRFRWLELLVGGFQCMWIWSLVTHAAGMLVSAPVTDVLGILNNYLLLVLINALVFYSSIYAEVFSSVSQHYSLQRFDDPGPLYANGVKKIQHAMQNDRPFLNARLTLEEFAEKIDIPPRLVSQILNRHFGQNFFEFINQHRVQEVKRMFADARYRDDNIIEISMRCGFNSKATFNRFFKAHVGQTPTEYRRSLDPQT